MTATTRRPGRPRDESIDEAILDATIDELIERGFPALSMEAIAARAGVAKSTLYRRWPGSDELAFEAMRRMQQTQLSGEPDGDARQGLLLMLEAMRRTWANPRYGALMRRVAADGTRHPEMYRSFRARLIGPNVEAMNRQLQRAVDAGLIRADVDLNAVRQLLVAPIMVATLTHKERLTRAQLEFTLDTVLRGLAP